MIRETRTSDVLTADVRKVLGVPDGASNVQILKIGLTTTKASYEVPVQTATDPVGKPAPVVPEIVPPEVEEKKSRRRRKSTEETTNQ